MTLLSMKVAKTGFLKDIMVENKLPTLTPVSEVRSKVLAAVKFIVSKELLCVDFVNVNALSLIGIEHTEKGYYLGNEEAQEKTRTLWAAFSKMPFNSIFLENSTGGLLVTEKKEGLEVIIIENDGVINPSIFLIPNEQKGFELLECIITFLPVHSEEIITEIKNRSKAFGLMIMNFLLHLNSRNKNVVKYNCSNKEFSNHISKVHRPLYTYHILDIYSSKPKNIENLKQIESISEKAITAHVRAHMVRGHFKQRASGLYWWNPFLRSKTNSGFVDKDYQFNA